MTRATSLRLALLTAVAALFASLLAAVPSAAAAAAPDPSKDHFWLPKRCVAGPGEYVPSKAGPCHVTKYRKNRPTVVLWGDSHAWQHLPAVAPLARKRNVNLVLFMLGGCPPILIGPHIDKPLAACETSNQMALKYVRRLKDDGKPVRVLLGAFWDGYYSVYKDVYVDKDEDPRQWTPVQLRSARTFHRLTPKLIAKLGQVGVRVDLIGQAASVPADPPACSRSSDPYACDLPRGVALPREKRWKGWLQRQVRPLPAGSRVVNFSHTYCGTNECHGFTDGIYTFFDPTHLSASRTSTFRKFFAPTFRGLG
jgi:hypothetical protein